MKKVILVVVIAVVLMSSCKKSPGTGNANPAPTATCYTGITSADINGSVISTDADDWKANGWLTHMLAYPNPSGSTVALSFQISSGPAQATMKIYDCSQALVSTLVTDCQAGANSVIWDGNLMPAGTRLPPGMYRCYFTLLSGTATTAQTYGDIELQ